MPYPAMSSSLSYPKELKPAYGRIWRLNHREYNCKADLLAFFDYLSLSFFTVDDLQ